MRDNALIRRNNTLKKALLRLKLTRYNALLRRYYALIIWGFSGTKIGWYEPP